MCSAAVSVRPWNTNYPLSRAFVNNNYNMVFIIYIALSLGDVWMCYTGKYEVKKEEEVKEDFFSCNKKTEQINETIPSIILYEQPSQRRSVTQTLAYHSQPWSLLGKQQLKKSWPLKTVTDWASFVVQSPSLAHLKSDPPTRLLSAAWWNTALPSGLTPLPHILLSLTPWKSRPSRSLESPWWNWVCGPITWPLQTDPLSFCILTPPFWSSTLCPHLCYLCVTTQASAGYTRSTSNSIWVKL